MRVGDICRGGWVDPGWTLLADANDIFRTAGQCSAGYFDSQTSRAGESYLTVRSSNHAGQASRTINIMSYAASFKHRSCIFSM